MPTILIFYSRSRDDLEDEKSSCVTESLDTNVQVILFNSVHFTTLNRTKFESMLNLAGDYHQDYIATLTIPSLTRSVNGAGLMVNK